MNLPAIISRLTSAGPVGVFVVFLLPWGPGAPAGILLARKEGMSPLLIVVLYVLSDVVTAIILEPLVQLLRTRGGRSKVGKNILDTFNRLGSITQVSTGRFGLPLGLFTFTFATDFFTASVASTGIPMQRVLAWICIIAGDVLWFLIILLATLGIASFLSDDRILFVATMLIGFALPPLMRRILRQRQSATNPPSQ
jgi:hypothetical protein